MKLSQIIGPMLDANEMFVHARGNGTVNGETMSEEYVRYRSSAALMRSDKIFHVTTQTGSRTSYRTRILDEGPPRTSAHRLGMTDTMLHPLGLYIWGRPGESWRLDDEVRASNRLRGAVDITLIHTETDDTGSITVAPRSGRLRHLAMDDTDWTVTIVADWLDADISLDFLASTSIAQILKRPPA